LEVFDKGNSALYDDNIQAVLDANSDNDTLFDSMKSYVICVTNKSVNLTNLSGACK